MPRIWLILTATLMLAACRSEHSAAEREVFDEQTGNTLTVVAKPLVFSRERDDLAAHARDYATLVAVEVDHSGMSDTYLLLYRWSTVDRRMLPKQNVDDGRLRLVGTGRKLDLQALKGLPVGMDSTVRLHMPPNASAVTRAYAVDLDVLRFIAVSDTLTLQLPEDALGTPFSIWEDGRPALARFLRHTSMP